MDAVKAGDLNKSTLLFERYQRPIFHFFLRQLYDYSGCEDLTQQVFLRMLKYKNSYKSGQPFKAWIFQMARNLRNDYYRQHAKKTSDRMVDVEKIAEVMAELCETEELAYRESQLHRAIAQLDEEQREIIVMTKLQQMKYEEVAELTGYSVGAIKVKVHRAIKKLRGIYFMLEVS